MFEAILEQRERYGKNRRRRVRAFQDLDYICCSTYGYPRSKGYHWPHFKKLLKNDFNLKVIAKLLGHAKEIISADVYGKLLRIAYQK